MCNKQEVATGLMGSYQNLDMRGYLSSFLGFSLIVLQRL